MKIEYELTKEDLAAFQKYHMAHSGRRFRVFQYVMIIAVALIVLAINKDTILEGPKNYVIMEISILVIVFGGLFLLLRKMLRNPSKMQIEYLVSKNPNLLSRKCLEITDGGLIIQNDSQNSKIGWAGIDRIEENDEYAFIYFNPRAAHIVPKRVFTDKIQELEFLNILRSKTGKGADK